MYINTGTLWIVIHESELDDQIKELESRRNQVGTIVDNIEQGILNSLGTAPEHRIDLEYTHRNTMAEKTHKIRKEIGENLNKEGKLGFFTKLWEFIRRSVYKGRDFIAKIMDKIRTWAQKVAQKSLSIPPEKRGIFEKIKTTLAQMLEFLMRKLHNFTQKYRGDIDTPNYKKALSQEDQAQINKLKEDPRNKNDGPNQKQKPGCYDKDGNEIQINSREDFNKFMLDKSSYLSL